MPAATPSARRRAPKPRLTLDEVMTALAAAGSEQTRKTYRRHGVTDPLFGVSFATLKQWLKRIGVDHELALALWDTGNYDARNLAYKIVEPARLTADQLDRWAREGATQSCSNYVAAVACEGPHARDCAVRWLASDAVGVRAAGWATVAALATQDTELADDWFVAHLDEIERSIHRVHNDQRYAMNGALIAIGCRNPALRAAASAAAARIGEVEIDLGDTACKTPVAALAIAKAWEHSLGKGFASPAAHERAREKMRLRC